MRSFRFLKQDPGFSLVEVLVVVAIMSIMALASAQMVAGQMKQQVRVLQKEETTQLKTNLDQVLANPLNCAQFANLTFLASQAAVAPGTSNTSFDSVTLGTGPGATLLAKAGAKLPGTQTGLMIDTVSLVNIVPTATTQYKASLQVTFLPASTSNGSIAPANVPLILNVSSSGDNRTILNCGGTTMSASAVCGEIIGASFDSANQTCTVPDTSQVCNGTTSSPGGTCYDTGGAGIQVCSANGWICYHPPNYDGGSSGDDDDDGGGGGGG